MIGASRASRTTGRAVSHRPAGQRRLTAVALLALGGTLGLAGAVVGAASPASAHNRVVATVPTADSTVTAVPENFSITTDLNMLDLQGGGRGFAIEVDGPDGWSYCPAEPEIVDNVMTVPAVLGPGGGYTLTWQLVSADGHTVSGDFPFTWQPPADFTAPKPGADGNPACSGGEATAAPSSAASDGADDTATGSDESTVPLGDVLWIGGAILAVLIAGGVTLLVLTRKPRDARGGGRGRSGDTTTPVDAGTGAAGGATLDRDPGRGDDGDGRGSDAPGSDPSPSASPSDSGSSSGSDSGGGDSGGGDSGGGGGD
ncbi:copper resistance CopC family protein [Schumannella sp. 10F1B-5-1]|uniref:copper resistance CopC family protein n=1 Tax=Schumannella sp. 10F1B-5-1 TaxID=2590780 RepID=UPI0015E87750|nr:copper resistance CopC family protein [Schumannella sp. 10F1B-5-1]